MADAGEEHGDRDGDEIIAASSAAIDDLHTLFLDRAAGGLDFFTRMRADFRRVGDKALTIGAEAKAGLPRTWCDAYSLHMATPSSADLYTCDASTCMADEYTLLMTLPETTHSTYMIISTRARNLAQHFTTVARNNLHDSALHSCLVSSRKKWCPLKKWCPVIVFEMPKSGAHKMVPTNLSQ